MQFPPISKALLDTLALAFPDKLPETPLDPSAYAVLIGQQNVIRCLRAQFKRQTEKGALADTQS